MYEPALCSLTTNGPSPAVSLCADLAESMATPSKSCSRLATGAGHCRVMEWVFLISLFTYPAEERKGSANGECRAGSINLRMVKATSSAENGVPSEKRTPSRSSKVMDCPLLETFHDVAISGCSCCVWRLRRIR